VAGRPLRPATDCRLGEPLPHQLANPTLAHPIARGLTIPRFLFTDVCGISQSFDWLFPTTGKIPMHYSPVRRSSACIATPVTARLACVRHAASVQSEPGSNSSVNTLKSLKFSFPETHICSRMNNWSFLLETLINCTKGADASPHTSYLFEFLKSYPRRQRSGERLSSIADFETSSIQNQVSKSPFTWKGAQYSPRFGPVNGLS
jgi:hypothetical protein